jgi:pre-rRNA-processing protein IPI1
MGGVEQGKKVNKSLNLGVLMFLRGERKMAANGAKPCWSRVRKPGPVCVGVPLYEAAQGCSGYQLSLGMARDRRSSKTLPTLLSFVFLVILPSMGSSAKKKREKKKDFQKAKLKVGKTRPKADNHTETNFRAKAIVLNQQLNVDAPSIVQQFHHHVSLLSSRAEPQRRDSLAFLATYIASAGQGTTVPQTIGSLLDKACPLILDGSASVRTQLLRFFQSLPRSDIQDQVPRLLPHVRAGMTHLARDLRLFAVEVLSWIIATAPNELVSCVGGWISTLECFTTMLVWRSAEIGKYSAMKPRLGDTKSTAKVITVLAEFLEAGLLESDSKENVQPVAQNFPYWDLQHHRIPTKSNGYAYLNLFGGGEDEKSQMLEDREDRQRVYATSFRPLIEAGIEAGKKEGGEIGRATGLLSKVLNRAASDSVD